MHFWKGLAALLLMYTMLQLVYYLPSSALPGWFRKTALSPLWILLAVVYATGWWILGQAGVPWLIGIWHFVHIALAGFALAILAYGYFIGPAPQGLAASVRPIVEFLISPVTYLGLGLLYRSTRRVA